ncbi:MAG: hypothetical protein FJ222_03835 [Lentisphaerae bacterium]|nr:hypothetical protein [Lentisphaerota bacterium]
MNVNGKPYRSIWINPNGPAAVQVIDQRRRPHAFAVLDWRTVEAVWRAILGLFPEMKTKIPQATRGIP